MTPRPPRTRRRKTVPPQRWWRGARLTRYGKQAISVLVLVGTLMLRDQETVVPVAKREEEQPPDSWAANTRALDEWYGFSGADRRIPLKPFPGQQLPPCTQKQEREINGGCWVLYGDPAPCGRGYFEHEGRCYKPVAVAQRPGTSIEE